jgi:DNA polymerase (family X)
LKYIAITDHSQRVTMARGLDARSGCWPSGSRSTAERASSGRGFTLLKGIECDILEKADGLPDDVLAQADWVVASVHYGQKQPREQITERIVGALENPHVSCIAHPTGR